MKIQKKEVQKKSVVEYIRKSNEEQKKKESTVTVPGTKEKWKEYERKTKQRAKSDSGSCSSGNCRKILNMKFQDGQEKKLSDRKAVTRKQLDEKETSWKFNQEVWSDGEHKLEAGVKRND